MENPALIQPFNLSRSRSLRTLETTAESITTAGDAASISLTTALSTTTSPLSLDLVVVYRDLDIDGANPWYNLPFCKSDPLRLPRSPDEMAADALCHQDRFKVFREMYETREFRLVLCADVSDPMIKYATEMLECLVNAEKAKGRLDYLLCEPLIIVEIRSPRTRPSDDRVGWAGRWSVLASAL